MRKLPKLTNHLSKPTDRLPLWGTDVEEANRWKRPIIGVRDSMNSYRHRSVRRHTEHSENHRQAGLPTVDGRKGKRPIECRLRVWTDRTRENRNRSLRLRYYWRWTRGRFECDLVSRSVECRTARPLFETKGERVNPKWKCVFRLWRFGPRKVLIPRIDHRLDECGWLTRPTKTAE